MNDIEILTEMFSCKVLVPLHQEGPRPPSVELTDKKSKGTVNIKGLPHNSIVIRAEDFDDPLAVFNCSKGECRRADFVIVSNDSKRWIICVEIQDGNRKKPREVIEQLKGALCFMNYCKCIGEEFWLEKEFLDGYEYRFVSLAHTTIDKKSTRPNTPRSSGQYPEDFLKLFGKFHHFSKLIQRIS